MIETTWEQATPEQYPIVAFLCYDSSLAVFKTSHASRKTEVNDMFSDLDPEVVEGEVPTGERREYRMRLPYTQVMLERRKEREWGML
jgi:hypothetical protein